MADHDPAVCPHALTVVLHPHDSLPLEGCCSPRHSRSPQGHLQTSQPLCWWSRSPCLGCSLCSPSQPARRTQRPLPGRCLIQPRDGEDDDGRRCRDWRRFFCRAQWRGAQLRLRRCLERCTGAPDPTVRTLLSPAVTWGPGVSPEGWSSAEVEQMPQSSAARDGSQQAAVRKS